MVEKGPSCAPVGPQKEDMTSWCHDCPVCLSLSLPFPQRVFRLKPAALMRQRRSHHVVIILLNGCKSIHLASQHLIRDSDPLRTFLCSYIFPPASPACPSCSDADRSNEQKSSEIIYITPQSAGNWNGAFVLMMSLVLCKSDPGAVRYQNITFTPTSSCGGWISPHLWPITSALHPNHCLDRLDCAVFRMRRRISNAAPLIPPLSSILKPVISLTSYEPDSKPPWETN